MRNILFLVLIFTVAFSSCYYDNEEYLYPSVDNTCDTTNVTFTKNIEPILQAYCLSCHSNSAAALSGSGIKLQDYADVVSRADAVFGSVGHSSGFSPMPKGGAKINDCKIQQISIWVQNGKKQN